MATISYTWLKLLAARRPCPPLPSCLYYLINDYK